MNGDYLLDQVYFCDSCRPCTYQLIAAFDRHGRSQCFRWHPSMEREEAPKGLMWHRCKAFRTSVINQQFVIYPGYLTVFPPVLMSACKKLHLQECEAKKSA